MSAGVSTPQRPTLTREAGAALAAAATLSSDRTESITTPSSRKRRPIVSGLPRRVRDLSSLMQMSPSSTPANDTKPVSPSLTTNSSNHSHLSQLLSLLPRKRQRHGSSPNGKGKRGFRGDDPSEDEDRAIRRRKPILKKGDEASHLCGDEREVGPLLSAHSISHSHLMRDQH